MLKPNDGTPRNFLSLFDFYDQEYFGHGELMLFYGVTWKQSTFGLSKDEEFNLAEVDLTKKTIKLFEHLDDKYPKKIVDFELSISANMYLNEE